MSNEQTEQTAQHFFEHIMDLAVERGLNTYTELAREAGVHHSTLSQYKRGERKPSIATMRKVANALDVELEVVEEGIKDGGNTPNNPGDGGYRITITCDASDTEKVVSLLTRAGLSADINIAPIGRD